MKSEDAKECRLLVQELNLRNRDLDNIEAECSNELQEIANHCEEEYPYNSDNEISQSNKKRKSKWSIFLNGDCDSDNNLEGDFEDTVCDKFSTNSSDNINDIGNEGNSFYCAKKPKLDRLTEEIECMEMKICNDNQLINENMENSNEKKSVRQNREERIFEDYDSHIDFDI